MLKEAGKKRKLERAFPGTFDIAFWIIFTHHSVFFIFHLLWLFWFFFFFFLFSGNWTIVWVCDDALLFSYICLFEYGLLPWWEFVDALIWIFVLNSPATPLAETPGFQYERGIPLNALLTLLCSVLAILLPHLRLKKLYNSFQWVILNSFNLRVLLLLRVPSFWLI